MNFAATTIILAFALALLADMVPSAMGEEERESRRRKEP